MTSNPARADAPALTPRRPAARTRLGRWLNRRADWRMLCALEREAGRPAPAWRSGWDRRGADRG